VIRMRNRATGGLGAPLPAGQVIVFQDGADRPILLGNGALDDKAIGEDVELDLPPTPGVSASVERLGTVKQVRRFRLTISNANPRPIAYEAHIDQGEASFVANGKTTNKDGHRLWAVAVPANGRAILAYSLRDRN
jgi:hypothetical protein